MRGPFALQHGTCITLAVVLVSCISSQSLSASSTSFTMPEPAMQVHKV